MRESDTPVGSPLGGYRAIMREVVALRGEVARLHARITTVLVVFIFVVLIAEAALWLRR